MIEMRAALLPSLVMVMALSSLSTVTTATGAEINTATDINALMRADGTQTCFEGNTTNAKGAPYTYRACHNQDGGIVAEADYGGDQVYQAEGTWRISDGAVCLDWETQGWNDGCHRPTKVTNGHTMTAVESGRVTTGTFYIGVPDHGSFPQLAERLSNL